MSTSLENTPPKGWYGDLLHLANGNLGVDATLRVVYDGKGNATCLMISSQGIKVLGDLEVTGSLVGQLQLSDEAPQPLGVADSGAGLSGSRSDHTHAHGDQSGGSLHAVATSSAAGFMSGAMVQKLGGIAAGATVNATDAQLRDRATHTGLQAIATVSGLQGALDGKLETDGDGSDVVVKGRTLDARAGDIVIAKDAPYNAKGDGSTNDTSAIQAAMTAAGAGSAKLPAGQYVISSSLPITSGVLVAEAGTRLTTPSDGQGRGNVSLGGHYIGDWVNYRSLPGSRILGPQGSIVARSEHMTSASQASPSDRAMFFWDGTVDNAYWQIGGQREDYLVYGKQAASSGTVNGLQHNWQIYSVKAELTGVTELCPIGQGITCRWDNNGTPVTQNNVAVYNDICFHGPVGTTSAAREVTLNAFNALVTKYCPGNVLDATHAGSYGMSVFTRPSGGGFQEQARPTTQASHPLRAGFQIAGWSGPVTSANNDGWAGTATAGYDVGLQIGGEGGSVWSDWLSGSNRRTRSKITVGADIRDWTDIGLRIVKDHPSALTEAPALDIWDAPLYLRGRTGGDARMQFEQQDGSNYPSGWIGIPSWDKHTLKVYVPTSTTGPQYGASYDGLLDKWDFATAGTSRFSLVTTGAAFSVPLFVTAGTTTAPSVAPSGDADTGLSFPAANTAAISTAGVEALRVTSGQVTVVGAPASGAQVFQGGSTPRLQALGSGANDASLGVARYGTSNGGLLSFARSRGAVGAHTAVQDSDVCGIVSFGGSDGAAFQQAATVTAAIDGSTISATSMPGRLIFSTTPTSGTTAVERLRISQDGTVTHQSNGTVIVGAGSHLGLRSYTVATLPSAGTAARLINVSDGAGNKHLAISDGTNWRWPDGTVVS